MSSYIHFFLRSEDKFIPLGTWSRNSKFYDAFSGLPFEHISLLTLENLEAVESVMRKGIEDAEGAVICHQESIDRISKFENSVSEKEEAIYDYIQSIVYEKQEIKEYETVIWFIFLLKNIISEQQNRGYNEDCIYAGVECYEPTVEDIQE